MNQNEGSRELNNGDGSGNGRFLCISDISSDKQIVTLVGLIISKEGPKTIISKKGSGAERHLIAFTLRDDPMAFINLTCWGGMDFIKNLADSFKIGDVAEVKGAQVQTKSNNPTDDKYKPWTPGSFQLNVSETHSSMCPYRGQDVSHYINLMHIPTRANNDFYTLEDIQENGINLQGEHISILALVKKIWPVREIVTKHGKTTSKVDIVLCDETCNSFSLTLWDNYADLVEYFTPMETVIFAADVRMSYSDYRSAMTGSSDSKTLFTINPETNEARLLRQYCKSQSIFSNSSSPDGTFTTEKDPEISTITDVLTVKEAKSRQSTLTDGGSQYCVLYPFLSQFDLDNEEKSIFKEVCSKCGRNVQPDTSDVCENPECGTDLLNTQCEYSLIINLTDHTGTLEHCYVPPHVAEQFLGYKASDLKYLPSATKTALKWEYLFERLKAVVKMRYVSGDKGNRHLTRLLDLQKVDSSELTEKAFTTASSFS